MSESLSPQEALRLILAECRTLEFEQTALDAALGRTLALGLVAQLSNPPFDSSAMDGFAVRASDVAERGARLTIVGESRAGHPFEGILHPGESVRISTGAMVPDRADAIARVEITAADGSTVTINEPVAPGTDLRPAGGDMQRGDSLLAPGTLLGPAEIAMIAANGLATAHCTIRPSVAVITTGDELRPPGGPLGPGEIFNSNGAALCAQVVEAGAVPTDDQWHAGDSRAGTTETVAAAIESGPDILLIGGGVSVGSHDHVKPTLKELAVRQVFWGVAQRPGHPLWFGTTGSTLVFGLPGNPVSAMVCFHVYVRRAIDRLLGSSRLPRVTSARIAAAYEKQPGRAQFARCNVSFDSDGATATLARNQASHALTSLVGFDGLAILDAGQGPLAAGDQVRVELF